MNGVDLPVFLFEVMRYLTCNYISKQNKAKLPK